MSTQPKESRTAISDPAIDTPSVLSPELADDIREALLLRNRHLADQALQAETLAGISQNSNGSAVAREAVDDRSCAMFDRERNLSLARSLRLGIRRNNQAIRRLDDGTYGECVRCGLQISIDRLLVVPATEMCLACQQTQDHSYRLSSLAKREGRRRKV